MTTPLHSAGKVNRLTRPYRATVSPECIDSYNKLKLDKVFKFVIFKLSDDNKEIVVEEASADADWENFREKLINAQTKSKSVCSPHNALVQIDPATSYAAITYSWVFSNRARSARDPATLFTTSSTSLLPAREHGRDPYRHGETILA